LGSICRHGRIGLVELLLQQTRGVAGRAGEQRHRPEHGDLAGLHQALPIQRLAVEGFTALNSFHALQRGREQNGAPRKFFLGRQIRGGGCRVHLFQRRLVARFFDEVQPRLKRPRVLGDERVHVFDLVGLALRISLERVQFDELVFLEALRLGELSTTIDELLFEFSDFAREWKAFGLDLLPHGSEFGRGLLQIRCRAGKNTIKRLRDTQQGNAESES
jgi:hypothetical protein